MNYYIDFDNTLYETTKLTKAMMTSIAKTISENSNFKFDEIIEDIESNFNSTYGNIFEYGRIMAEKYNVDSSNVIKNINEVIFNGNVYVFEDSKRFLKKLKEGNYTINILTYIAKGNQEYQLKKLFGSGISNNIDRIIVTSDLKYTLDIDYKNGIFIDDNPRDLKGLYEQNPQKVIRMRRKNNKYYSKEIENINIEEYNSFDDIIID